MLEATVNGGQLPGTLETCCPRLLQGTYGEREMNGILVRAGKSMNTT
jgi:hypothetical protein